LLEAWEPDPDDVKNSFITLLKGKHHENSSKREDFWEVETVMIDDDTDEFVYDNDKTWRLPKGFIGNQNWGVKKMLPTSKASFINWRNEANLKSFHSIYSNMNQITEMTHSR